jgi:hypothetical protein
VQIFLKSEIKLLRNDSENRRQRLTIEDVRVSSKFDKLFEDPIFESWILTKLSKRKYGLALSSFKLYVTMIYDFVQFVALTPREIVENAYPMDKRLEWKLKLEPWFNLMVGQVEPKNDLEVPRHDWNSAKKGLAIANEFFKLNNIDLGS